VAFSLLDFIIGIAPFSVQSASDFGREPVRHPGLNRDFIAVGINGFLATQEEPRFAESLVDI
jgi:hypothetical protein